MKTSSTIVSVSGSAVSVLGNDIDTDRIIPARFLRCVTFDGLGEHAFADDRKGLQAQGLTHPFDLPRNHGSSILFVNQNFGCGSSREHAPQSLMRWGIKAIIGESFAEIFFGNCVSLGIPCVTVSSEVAQKLQSQTEKIPESNWTLDLASLELHGPMLEKVFMADGPRFQFLHGQWNPISDLISHFSDIDRVADSLPYVNGRWN